MRRQLGFYLKSVAALTAVVAQRIYQQRAPTGAVTPYVVYSINGGTPNYDTDGEDGNERLIVEIESSGVSIAQADSANIEVRKAMDIQFQLIGDTGDQEYLMATTRQSEFDNFDLFDGSQQGVRTITTTYELSYKE